jgi:ubiquitin-activating enzyme E1
MASKMDEDLYSRQIAVLGHDAMRRMQESDILVCGMRGLGVEVAKNVALGGVKSLTIYDPNPAEMMDLAGQYYLKESDLGKNRAEVTITSLAELNPHVPIKVLSKTSLTEADLAPFKVIVSTDLSKEENLMISDYAHAQNICFIQASSQGLFGHVFCDFGVVFNVQDTNGENPKSSIVNLITQESEGIVTGPDDSRHGFEDGDYVTFAEVEGMEALNGCEPRKIKVLGPSTFSIGDTSGLGPYTRGGIVTQVKMPKAVEFKSLRENLSEPNMSSPSMGMTDFGKFERPMQLHVAYQAVLEFRAANGGKFPRPGNDADGAAVVELGKKIAGGLKDPVEVDEDLLRLYASQSSGNITPMNGFIGGVAAQEVMKACSGKFHPIHQYMYFDSLESLPSKNIPSEQLQPQGNRYDGQTVVLGTEMQKKLGEAKYFLVGAGAIGCELLKNFSMIGLCCGPGGKLVVTDMDVIETSNLNRQFLFRPKDVKNPKSTTAAAAAKVMNPNLNVEAQENRVCQETEGIYGDEFFMGLTGVANALDNVEARQYVDRRCVFYKKPLLESGTLGTKGNTQIVIPHITESYSSTQDPPEASIPMCTLKNFPNKPEHTLQWARDTFAGLFEQGPQNMQSFLTDDTFVEGLLKQPGTQPQETLALILDGLVTSRPSSFDDCIKWARLLFQDLFHNGIAQLLYNFPKDQVTSEGVPFWSGPKRCPTPLNFDVQDETHCNFIMAAANLRAQVFGIPEELSKEKIQGMVSKVEVPKFAPKKGLKIAANDKEAEEMQKEEAPKDGVEELLTKLPAPNAVGDLKVIPLEFEKDDDTNHHIDFIAATANLRSANYEIKAVSRHEAKIIAGKIIPAIATTTAVVAGLITMELYKIIAGHSDIESYRDGFVNLALPFVAMNEPQACKKQKYNDTEWSLWDRFEIIEEMTLKEFIDHFQDKYQLEVTMLSSGVSMLYSFFTSPDKLKARMPMKMTDLVAEVSKKAIEPHTKYLIFEIIVDDAEGEEVDVPFVQYKVHN